MEITGIAQQLAEKMIELSKKNYGSRWCMFLEFELWKEITDELDVLNEKEAEKLIDLAESAGGWIMMDYQTDQLEFILMDRWEKYYERKKPF